MSFQPVKFYQTGTYTVGNRLLAPDERSVQASEHRTNAINSGHRACQGCGEALGARYAIDAAMLESNGQLIAANATGCLEVFSTPYPESSWQVPWIHSLFGNAPAVATGIAAAMKVKGRHDVRMAVTGTGLKGFTAVAGLGGRPIPKASLHKLFREVEQETLEPVSFVDLDWDVVNKQLERERQTRHSGPIAENILHDKGIASAAKFG